jgi:hypothetical protein
MPTSPTDNQHPRFGFHPITPFTDALTDLSLTGTSHIRPAGLFEGVVLGVFVLTAGPTEVNLILEGSNVAGNWVAISSLAPGNRFTASSQKTMGVDDVVEYERWNFLRVRAVVVSGAPTFTLATQIGGVAGDGEKFLKNEAIVRTGAAMNGRTWIRPAGTRYFNFHFRVQNFNGTSYTIAVQGSPDAGTTWETIASANFLGDGYAVLSDSSGSDLLDLGQFGHFRVRVVDLVPGATPAYTVNYYMSLDSQDWLYVTGTGGGAGVPAGLAQGLVNVVMGTPGARAGGGPWTVTTTLQVMDADGNPATRAVTLEAVLYDVTRSGVNDAAALAQFAGGCVTVGTLRSTVPSNTITFDTDATGAATLVATDAVAEAAVYLTCFTPRAPQATKTVVWQATQATLNFSV